MSKKERELPQVYSFLRKSIESQKEQNNALEMMLNRMLEVESNVNQVAAEIKVFAKEFRDENRLLPSEIDELYTAVVNRSIELAKARNDEESEDFPRKVGKYRKFIWSKTKKRYGTSKYIHIRRVDFQGCNGVCLHIRPGGLHVMFYIKKSINGKEIKVDIDDEFFTQCVNCGKEILVDYEILISVLQNGDLYSTQIACCNSDRPTLIRIK